MVTNQTSAIQHRTREEAESILWAPVKRGWERGSGIETAAAETMAKFPEYDIKPLVEPTIANPVAHPTQPTLAPQPQFQTYLKPGQAVGIPTRPVADDAHLEKIFEVEVAEPVQEPRAERVVEEEQYEEQASFKINARGFVAIAAFFATVILVTVLIVANSTAIARGNTRISDLRDQNAVYQASVNQAMSQRNDIYNTVTGNIQADFTATQNGNTATIQGEQFTQLPDPVRVPNTNQLRPSTQNPDQSTNWFDRLSRWLSNLFRRG
ncbi:MAG: hypothetical protein FWE31_02610 [Firmicutes bacterium]|nr:hypothetical protein [Bacillota bacterium]